MLLSVGSAAVVFASGSTLYEQDQDDFLADQFAGGSTSTRQASWLRGLLRQDMPFCMGLAGAMAIAWTDASHVCSFFDRFGGYYRSRRPQLEQAARDLRYVVEALLALERWPRLVAPVVESMGEQAHRAIPRTSQPNDLGAFLGRLLTGGGLTLDGVPRAIRALRDADSALAEEFRRTPHMRRMLDNLESHSQMAAEEIEQLRGAAPT